MIRNTCLALCGALALLGGNVLVASEESQDKDLPEREVASLDTSWDPCDNVDPWDEGLSGDNWRDWATPGAGGI